MLFRSLTPSQSEANARTYTTVQDAQADDGAGVLAILDAFKPEEMDYFEPQTIEQEVEDWNLTKVQYELAKKVAQELHITPSVGNSAAMVPPAFQDAEKAEYLPDEYSFDSHSALGSILPPSEAREAWIEQWDSVLNRYQDEVWGGMAPLVKEAKEEIKEIVEGSEGRQPKALARLGLVLGHISGVRQQVGKEKERERQMENELMEAAEREAHKVPVHYGTWDPAHIHAQRMEESPRNGFNPSPSGSPTGDAMEDAWARSNYGPRVYMQPEEATQAQRYQTWFEKDFTSNEK